MVIAFWRATKNVVVVKTSSTRTGHNKDCQKDENNWKWEYENSFYGFKHVWRVILKNFGLIVSDWQVLANFLMKVAESPVRDGSQICWLSKVGGIYPRSRFTWVQAIEHLYIIKGIKDHFQYLGPYEYKISYPSDISLEALKIIWNRESETHTQAIQLTSASLLELFRYLPMFFFLSGAMRIFLSPIHPKSHRESSRCSAELFVLISPLYVHMMESCLIFLTLKTPLPFYWLINLTCSGSLSSSISTFFKSYFKSDVIVAYRQIKLRGTSPATYSPSKF